MADNPDFKSGDEKGPILSGDEIAERVKDGEPGDGYDYARGIEREGSAPPQQGDAVEEKADLVGLISDEFGIARSVARRDLLMGTVTIDGEPFAYSEAGLFVDRSLVVGKTVEVKGGDTNRTYRFQVQ